MLKIKLIINKKKLSLASLKVNQKNKYFLIKKNEQDNFAVIFQGLLMINIPLILTTG